MEGLSVIAGEAAAGWGWLIQHILLINVFFSIAIIFFQRRDPKSVWTWLFALNFIPVFGILFYLLFGQDLRKSKMFRIKEVEDRIRFSVKTQEQVIREENPMESDNSISRDYSSLVLYNLETAGAVFTWRNRLDIFTDGQKKFADLCQELEQAQQYIHIQYYIIKNDEVFDSIMPILLKKVREGVEIRVLSDGMGGRFMPKEKWNMLSRAGIQVGIFFPPILGRLNLRVNYRNHRKIVVIDGRVGYVGGFNIGKEYISKVKKFGYWRDTHLKIQGDAVFGLQIRFALDWNYAVRENLFLQSRYFERTSTLGLENLAVDRGVGIQIISSGPDTRTKNIRDNYLEMFHKAKNHIYIQTPYFVPDDAILSALKIASRSGVDVRLMIPCKPDHPFVYWATYSYMGELIDAGAKCYVYENGFLHAKGIMVDGMVSCYGTANMDIRSFELNFEVNAVIYNEEATEQLEQVFLEDLPHCREITKEIYKNRKVFIRIKEQFCRLLSPLL